MRLGKASAYGVFAAIYIAKHQSAGPVQGRAIADAYGIPPEYLLKILNQLVRSRVLDSETGRRGGFVLRNPPDLTSLLDIIETIDGPIDGDLTVRKEVAGSEEAKDRVEAICRSIADYARDLLGRTSVQQLINVDAPAVTVPR
jgi:Rrf2 family protein